MLAPNGASGPVSGSTAPMTTSPPAAAGLAAAAGAVVGAAAAAGAGAEVGAAGALGAHAEAINTSAPSALLRSWTKVLLIHCPLSIGRNTLRGAASPGAAPDARVCRHRSPRRAPSDTP